ncbi:NUDIX domain-containing protein [Nocardia alni]|uniref:NUDIX domain-containing protein n=1 Tax=Nocardia alni TaxID=2815723 RepID=UPI001C23C25A|nr:NUDIX domain-containing protein [Nocardia alni]
METATALVADIVRAIAPMDSLEQQHIDLTLSWLASTDDIFRRVRPATPPQHLVSYIALVDPVENALYLGLHRLAGLHLPMGGHVDPGEHPLAAARRETAEELGIDADFSVVGDRPLFLTVTPTVDADTHTDVSLWYVIRGSRQRDYALDRREFDGGRWWDIDPSALPESDPHLGRFLTKLRVDMLHRPVLDR